MLELKEVYKKRFREDYRKWLLTRGFYPNYDGLTDKEVEQIKEEVYNSLYKKKNGPPNQGE